MSAPNTLVFRSSRKIWGEQRGTVSTGVVVHHVYRRVFREDVLQRTLKSRRIGNVSSISLSPDAFTGQFGFVLAQFVGVASHHEDVEAALSETAGKGEAISGADADEEVFHNKNMRSLGKVVCL